MRYKFKIGNTVLTNKGEKLKLLGVSNNYGLVISDKSYKYFCDREIGPKISIMSVNYWKTSSSTKCKVADNIQDFLGKHFQWITPDECCLIYPNTELYRRLYPDHVVEGNFIKINLE